MAKALLIDLDGVLRIWDSAHDCELEHNNGLPPGAILTAAFAPELLTPAITGVVSDEVWRLHVAEVSVQGVPDGKSFGAGWPAQ